MKFHDLDHSVIYRGAVVIYKTMLTLQVAGAHCLYADSLRIIEDHFFCPHHNPGHEFMPWYMPDLLL